MSDRIAPSGETALFETIWLEGALFVPDLLEKASRGDLKDQQAADYGLPKGLRLQEEIGRSFQIALAQWKDFSLRRVRPGDEKTASLAFMQEFLRNALGYVDLAPMPTTQYNGRTFPVSYRAKGRVPVVLASCTVDLDEADTAFALAGTGSRRKTPFQLLQEFLNASVECVWGLCANGLRLRLARDAETLTRPSYLEFDLEALLGEARYPDFAALWRVLHASRAGKPDAPPTACMWESWRAQGQAQGMRVRDGLRNGVTAALKELGEGFLQAQQNEALRTALRDGSLTSDGYFQELLRTVYRFLFLFTVEERDILTTSEEEPSPAQRAARTLYAQGYSMRRLRDRCRRLYEFDTHSDLWLAVGIVFRGLASGEPRLDLPALGGLFAATQCPHLDTAVLENRFLLKAQQYLRWAALAGTYLSVDYRNMGPEELGSVYESLLELVPKVDLTARSFGFIGLDEEGSTAGNARKTTGSYYTPDSLVQQLLKTALDPVIEERLAAHSTEPAQALLRIRVIDPACGSGHFLLAAARRLAERLAQVRSEDGVVKPAAYRHALREVIARCIHGVDRNPMALELARTALWLEGFEPGRALSFLDHHLVCGDALLGVMDLKQLEMGIPQDAYKPLSGDDPEICKELLKANKISRKALADLKEGGTLFLPADRKSVLAFWKSLEEMPDLTPEQVEAKAEAYRKGTSQERHGALAQAADLYVGAFLAQKTNTSDRFRIPTTAILQAVLFGIQDQASHNAEGAISWMQELCTNARVLHWPIAFPQVFASGGFDCVLGNPPWERIKLQEEEFFASRHPYIAASINKAERSKRIGLLKAGKLSETIHLDSPARVLTAAMEMRLYSEFQNAKREAEAQSKFAHLSSDQGGRFGLTGVGDVNTYALFSETISSLTNLRGRAGFIVPTGIATDDSAKAFFVDAIQRKAIASIISFFEIRKWFTSTDDRKAFCLLTLAASENAHFIFNVVDLSDLLKPEKWFTLSTEDFQLLNPNTKTCPMFRSEWDSALNKKIYRRVPIFVQEGSKDSPEINPWGIRFSTMFHMSGDSVLFRTSKEDANNRYLPLYEAKLIHHFDHRWGTYISSGDTTEPVNVTISQKQDPLFQVTPHYWVEEKEVLGRIARVPRTLAKSFALGNARTALYSLAVWIEETVGKALLQDPRQVVIDVGGYIFEQLPESTSIWNDPKLCAEAKEVGPLNKAELENIRNGGTIENILAMLLDSRSPKWLMGFRDISRGTDERTVIGSFLPRAAVGHKLPLIFPDSRIDCNRIAALLANLCSLVFDYLARQKMGSTNLAYFILKQLPVLPPEQYSEADLEYIVPRVVELSFTEVSLKPLAESMGYTGNPFPHNPARRALLRAELDAYFARLYDISLEELKFILDPSELMGPNYPSETFRVLKNNETREFGEYRTQRLILEAWDALP
ncbi:MAG: DNA methyltransferase [Fibrobacteria bacterium]